MNDATEPERPIDIDNSELPYLLIYLQQSSVGIPEELLSDMLEGECGTLNSAGALGAAVSALYHLWKASRTSIEVDGGPPIEIQPATFDFAIDCVVHAFEELRTDVSWTWDYSMEGDRRLRRAVVAREKLDASIRELEIRAARREPQPGDMPRYLRKRLERIRRDKRAQATTSQGVGDAE